jgi:hypothetical protein
MADVLFVVAALVFFTLAAAYIRLCDRVIEPEERDR